MAVGSFFAAAILAHFQLFRLLDVSALAAISFFNMLFVFLLFPLDGTLFRKLVLLFAGNSVGGSGILSSPLLRMLFYF